MYELECNECGHEWVSYDLYERCPECGSDDVEVW